MHSLICSQHKDAIKDKISELSRKLKIFPPVNTNLTLCPKTVIAADIPSNREQSEVEVVPTNMTKPSRAKKSTRRYGKKPRDNIFDVPDGNSMFLVAPLNPI